MVTTRVCHMYLQNFSLEKTQVHMATPPPPPPPQKPLSFRQRLFSSSSLVADESSTITNRRVPFYRRKTSTPTLKQPSLKSSFLSRVVTKVVPCVSAPVTPITSNSPLPLQDLSKPDLVDIALPLPTDLPNPPSPTDSDVVVTPPVSASLLPEDETDGMTSGAVQPPGSSGTPIVHSHSHDSDDSDRTSYTDDEHHEEDDEERLIKSGGSGIPIGPVRLFSSFNFIPSTNLRMAL